RRSGVTSCALSHAFARGPVMRVGRIVAFTAGTIVVLLVIVVVALLLFVHPDSYRGRIEEAVRQQTGRELTIGGKLELRIFPWLAFSVQGLSLGNPPEFGSQPFLTVQQASIGVRPLPMLLSRRLEVSRISVDGLSAHLVKRGTTNNWHDLTESKSTAAPPPRTASGSGHAISVGRIDL